jgi:PAS domain S-box-containing protein/putative nucleotidyltransferase with HDIG domain
MKFATREIDRQERDALNEISSLQGMKPVLTREYEAIFKNNGKPMVIVEEDATIYLVNAEFVRLSGYAKHEIEGKKNWMEFVATDDRRRVKEYYRLRRTDPILSTRCCEFRFLNRYGKIKNVVLTIGQIPGATKNMASLLDVTDRRQSEATQRVSEGRYKAIFENSRDAIYITTSDGTYVDANQATLDLFGYTGEEMKKINARQLYADPADARRFLKEIGEKGFVRDLEVRLHTKDGTVIDCLFTVTAQRGDNGDTLEYQGSIRDITEHKQAEEALQRSYHKIRETLVATVNTLASTVEMRDPSIAGHQRRVTILACAIAESMGLTGEQFDGLRLAGLIHDIGKISVPVEILNKPGRINEMEFNIIKTHPQTGYNLLKDIEFPWPVAQIVLQHHERLDGSGYPQRLKNGGIMLEAKVLAVADVVEAMVFRRPYRPALDIEVALEEITKNRKILYDPEVVDVCKRLFREKGFSLDQEITAYPKISKLAWILPSYGQEVRKWSC